VFLGMHSLVESVHLTLLMSRNGPDRSKHPFRETVCSLFNVRCAACDRPVDKFVFSSLPKGFGAILCTYKGVHAHFDIHSDNWHHCSKDLCVCIPVQMVLLNHMRCMMFPHKAGDAVITL
jgi:hypothetical protein